MAKTVGDLDRVRTVLERRYSLTVASRLTEG
jgi:hypothetical protein